MALPHKEIILAFCKVTEFNKFLTYMYLKVFIISETSPLYSNASFAVNL